MKNYQVAQIFENIADLMEIEGESPYKISAYRKAADTFSCLTDDLEQIASRDALRTIPGVGEAIEIKTKQILATGTCDLYEKLRVKYPPTLLDLLGLPGVGARTIRTLYDQLQVQGLEDLKQAAESGRLRDIPRMGAKAEQKILESIQRLQARPRGIPIVRALPMTEALANQLEAMSHVQKSWAAGHSRRFLELSSDITVVISTSDPADAIRVLKNSVQPEDVLEEDPHRVRVSTHRGEIVLLAEEPSFAGSALVRGTGSELHLRALEELAQQRGMEFKGTRLRVGEQPLEAPDEESFYRHLGMDYIPPELREGGDEIQAALQGRLPELVRADDIRGDLHAHTVASDGRGTAEDLAREALARDYEYFAITDHSQALTMVNGLTPERVREQAPIIEEANRNYPGVRLLKGIEVDIRMDGSLDLPDDVLEELDWVVGSIHSAMALPEKEMTARAVRALRSPHVDAMAHPTGRIIGERDPHSVNVETLIQVAAEERKALEINSFLERLDLNAENAAAAARAGVKLVISTDSHHPSQLDKIHYGIGMARRAWLTRDDVLNTMTLEQLMDWVRDR